MSHPLEPVPHTQIMTPKAAKDKSPTIAKPAIQVVFSPLSKVEVCKVRLYAYVIAGIQILTRQVEKSTNFEQLKAKLFREFSTNIKLKKAIINKLKNDIPSTELKEALKDLSNLCLKNLLDLEIDDLKKAISFSAKLTPSERKALFQLPSNVMKKFLDIEMNDSTKKEILQENKAIEIIITFCSLDLSKQIPSMTGKSSFENFKKSKLEGVKPDVDAIIQNFIKDNPSIDKKAIYKEILEVQNEFTNKLINLLKDYKAIAPLDLTIRISNLQNEMAQKVNKILGGHIPGESLVPLTIHALAASEIPFEQICLLKELIDPSALFLSDRGFNLIAITASASFLYTDPHKLYNTNAPQAKLEKFIDQEKRLQKLEQEQKMRELGME